MGRRWVGRAVLAAAAAAVAAATACAPGAAAAPRAGAAPRGSVGAPRPVAARAAGGGGSADADAVAEPAGHRSIPRLEIDLDQAPEDRYRPLFAPGLAFNATLWRFYETCFAHDPPLRDALYALSRVRGDEPEEMMAEIAGVAALSGLDVEFVKATQMLYELQTLMVPWENFTYPDAHLGSLVPGGEAVATAPLARIPWRGPGCTGIVAKCADGTVWHARNLDFSPRDIVAGLIYEGVFTRGGKELFRSQVVAGYLQVITASVMGDDGYVLERNTRYPDHAGGNGEMLRNLLGGRPLNGWVLRKILESEKTFDGAIQAITDAQYVSTEYAIVSGVGKGHVLARVRKRAHVALVSRASQRRPLPCADLGALLWCAHVGSRPRGARADPRRDARRGARRLHHHDKL